ncbi:MAG: hypothetical protein JWM68_1063 [Verrucomicrobiales bacterium]|nr:hypothetical protein [Verrucomicrobiales bacterium]
MEKGPWLLRSKGRFFLTLFFVLAVPTAVLVLLIATYVRKDLQRQAIEHNSLTARLVSQSLDEEFYGMQRFVEGFARRTKLIESVEKRDIAMMRGKLNEMISINAKFSRGFLADTNGNLIGDHPLREELIGKNFAHRDWFKGASKINTAYVSEIYQRVNMDQLDAISVCVRVQATNGTHIGFLAAQLTVDKLAAWLQAVKPSADGLVELFDQRGTPALPNKSKRPDVFRLDDLKKKFQDKEGWVRMTDPLSGDESILTYVAVPKCGWTVVARQPLHQVFGPVDILLRTILIFFVVCLAGTGLIGYVLFDTLSKHDTRRRLSEQALEKQAVQLKNSNEELEGMCYSIAHDLRAPLRAMRGFTSALIEDYDNVLDSNGQNYTRRIDQAAGRMDELIQDLLDYGKLGHVDLPVETISLQSLVKEVLGFLAQEIKEKQACIDVEKSLPNVKANLTILEQVFTNLISNSLKFVALGIPPQIKISAEVRGEKVRVSVRDNGIGIDQAHHTRIFGVFERLHGYETYPGTGIGLAIVRKGVERMGGTMGLESEVNKGSCFWFELPKA